MSAFHADRPLSRSAPTSDVLDSGRARAGFTAFAALAFCGLSLAALPLPALAQQDSTGQAAPQKPGAPVRLAPPVSLVPGQKSVTPGQQPAGATPSVPSAAAVKSGAATRAAGQIKKGIEIDSLSDVDPNSIGAIDAGRGGLGADLWRGSDRRTLAGLLQRAPREVSSPALRDLLRRTLLSVADAPPASGPVAPLAQLEPGIPHRGLRDDSSAAGFLSLRAEALAELGESEALKDLLAVVPRGDVDQVISRVQVETLMLLQEDVTACAIVRDAVLSYAQEPFWPKALMYCQILDGDINGAILGLDLLREGGGDDATFFELVESAEAAMAGAVNDVAAGDPSPLHMSLARATNQRVVPEDMARVQPKVLAVIAAAPVYDLQDRAAAAEQAVRLGSLPASGLGEIYQGFTFGADELFAPIEAASIIGGLRARALLYQAAVQQDLAAARAEILFEAFARLRRDGLSSVANKLLLPLLAGIEPSRELVWFAETAGRALYLTGRTEQADAWAAEADRLAAVDPQAKGAALGLWPYRRLSSAAAPSADGRSSELSALGTKALATGATRIAASQSESAQPGSAQPGSAQPGLAQPDNGQDALANVSLADWMLQRSAYLKQANGPAEGADALSDEALDKTASLSVAQVTLLRALFSALGENDSLSWSELALFNAVRTDIDGSGPDLQPSADPRLLLALEQASRGNRKGESVLLAAMVAGDPIKVSGDLLASVTAVRSLHRLGLSREARALAMEAAESSGL